MGRYYASPDAEARPIENDKKYNEALFKFFAVCLRRFGPMPSGSRIEINVLDPNALGAPMLMVQYAVPEEG